MIEIIIPAYNCASTLKRTLDSLQKQSNKNFTVLLVDDCSTEDIYSIVEEYKSILSLRYLRNEVNVGVGMTRQRGIDETTAEYIAFLDADDILLPNAIDDWSQEIKTNSPEVIYSPFIYIWNIGCKVTDYFWMCHGKVYKTSFLRQYNIRESEQVKCIDDGYLNWQAFDLADNISLLTTPTYVQIYTRGSVTCAKDFSKRAIKDVELARKLAAEQISRFKDNPFENYEAVNCKVKELLCSQKEIYKKLTQNIKYQSLN